MNQVAIASPWVKFDPITENYICDRCRGRQQCIDRHAEAFIGIGERFLEIHRTCRSSEEMFAPPDRKDLD